MGARGKVQGIAWHINPASSIGGKHVRMRAQCPHAFVPSGTRLKMTGCGGGLGSTIGPSGLPQVSFFLSFISYFQMFDF